MSKTIATSQGPATVYKVDGLFTFAVNKTDIGEYVYAIYWDPDARFDWSTRDCARFIERADRRETLDEVKARMEAWAAQALPCMVAGSKLDLHQRVLRYHAAGMAGIVLRAEVAAQVVNCRVPFEGWHLKLVDADLVEGLTWEHIEAIHQLGYVASGSHRRVQATYDALRTAPPVVVARLFSECVYDPVNSLESLAKIAERCGARCRCYDVATP